MCALALGFCASAQNVYEQVVNDQLDIAEKEVTRIAASNGATATLIEQINGTLEDDGDDQISLTLRPNTLYALIGACDQDCSDIDIVVHDADRNETAADREVDDVPIVTFETKPGDEYHYHLEMYECSSSICYYGVALYRFN